MDSYLRELHADPRFLDILDKIKQTTGVPSWKKAKDAEEWIYQSGRADERNRILQLLGDEK